MAEIDHYAEVIVWLQRHCGLSDSALMAAENLRASREPAPLALNRLGSVSDIDLQAAFMAVSGLPAAEAPVNANDAQLLAPGFMKTHRAAALESHSGEVHLGVVDPFDTEAVDGVIFATGRQVRLSVLRGADQRRLHAATYENAGAAWSSEIADRRVVRQDMASEFDRDAPVARRVAGWLAAAVERRASDVHIEPRANALIIRFRIDGALEAVAEEPSAAATAVLARIKVLADLDLGERRMAQDGRTTIVVGGRPIDLRVSIVPSVHGEAAVLRILDRSEVKLRFDTLGFSGHEQALLERAIAWPHGLFLVTGPTGSGKTTTLYACLEAMQGSARKTLTIEDPVEYHFDHVTQVQTAPRAGVTFASAIRAFLRQDPDVILVGEIRDSETAAAAVQAALTGHLVLATLHAIDAVRVVPRLLDMGVEPFQLSACLRGALSQRLVRRLCQHCRRARDASRAERDALGLLPDARLHDAVGCIRCHRTGYVGRVAIAEGFEVDEAFLAALRDGQALEGPAMACLGDRLMTDGARKAGAGLTTGAEVLRALSG